MREIFKALDEGKMITRKDWKKGTFVFKQVPSEISMEIVPNMQSLPKSVKDEFVQRYKNNSHPDFRLKECTDEMIKRFSSIRYYNQYALVNFTNEITGFRFDSFEDDGNWIVI